MTRPLLVRYIPCPRQSYVNIQQLPFSNSCVLLAQSANDSPEYPAPWWNTKMGESGLFPGISYVRNASSVSGMSTSREIGKKSSHGMGEQSLRSRVFARLITRISMRLLRCGCETRVASFLTFAVVILQMNLRSPLLLRCLPLRSFCLNWNFL